MLVLIPSNLVSAALPILSAEWHGRAACSSKKPYPRGVPRGSGSAAVVVEHTAEPSAPFDCLAD